MGQRKADAPSDATQRMRIKSNGQLPVFVRWLLRTVYNFINHTLGLSTAFAVLSTIWLGWLRMANLDALIALGVLSVLLVMRLGQRVYRGLSYASNTFNDFELGTLLVVAAFAIFEVTGGSHSLLYPLIYALVSFLVAFHGLALGAYFLLLIISIEAIIFWRYDHFATWHLLLSHISLNIFFAALSSSFLRSELLDRKTIAEKKLRAYINDIQTQAREYRLTSGLLHTDRELNCEEIDERRHLGSVQAISQSLYNLLGIAEPAISPHTVALMWLDDSDHFFRIKELRSQSNYITEKPISVGAGFLGVINKRQEILQLTNLKPGHSGLVYYDRPQPVTDFIGIPVMEGSFLRGILLADRINATPFSETDMAVLTTLAAEIVRSVEVERVFAEMDHAKFQQEKFYEASREFNQTLTVHEVAKITLEAAKRVAHIEFSALAVLQDGHHHIRIEAIDWAGHNEADLWIGQTIDSEHSLVGAAIKAQYPLPHGTVHNAKQTIFAQGYDLPLPAVKVVPLIARGKSLGALVIASSQKNFLPMGTIDMIKVIADHAAIALSNAQLFEHNERLATTDGLTGLVNHRHFQYLFDQTLAQAERYNRKLSILITDIDHFKSVNDTYGHPVGDKVLKRVANIVAQTARAKIDTVARYGGEEFAVLLPETDQQGALQLAERIRVLVKDEQFYCEQGKFRSSISLGIATYPDDATTKPKLIDCADQALYFAKHQGRNRCINYAMLNLKREG
ncbi:MAG: diguanylate cyclase [Deltaproteobacteria bacterium]|nr:diguanylate cyclase [Deltaproteobacteria bacterium]